MLEAEVNRPISENLGSWLLRGMWTVQAQRGTRTLSGARIGTMHVAVGPRTWLHSASTLRTWVLHLRPLDWFICQMRFQGRLVLRPVLQKQLWLVERSVPLKGSACKGLLSRVILQEWTQMRSKKTTWGASMKVMTQLLWRLQGIRGAETLGWSPPQKKL